MQTTNRLIDELRIDVGEKNPEPDFNPPIPIPPSTDVVPVSALDTITSGFSIVPEPDSPQGDYNAIFEEHILGATIRERAFFRLWRLKRSEDWKVVTGVSGELYHTWESVVKDIGETLEIGRQIIFDRMKLYDQLDWLGYTDHEKIVMLSRSPSLYHRLMDRLVDWDAYSQEPKSVMIPNSDSMSKKEAQDELRNLIADAEKFPRQVDALRYVDEQILLVPQIQIWIESDVINVSYSQTAIAKNGDVYEESAGTIRYYPDTSVPDWVITHLKKGVNRQKHEK